MFVWMYKNTYTHTYTKTTRQTVYKTNCMFFFFFTICQIKIIFVIWCVFYYVDIQVLGTPTGYYSFLFSSSQCMAQFGMCHLVLLRAEVTCLSRQTLHPRTTMGYEWSSMLTLLESPTSLQQWPESQRKPQEYKAVPSTRLQKFATGGYIEGQ